MGGKFYAGVCGMAAAAVVAGILLFWIFGRVWYTWGLIGAFVLFGGVLLGLAYIKDRRDTRDLV